MNRQSMPATGGKMSSELELVVRLARPHSPENERRVVELLGKSLDWNEVLASAIQHKLILILQERLQAYSVPSLGPEQHATLAEYVRNTGMKNLTFLGETLRLYRLFDQAKIPAIPHRGPVLAWMAYRNFGQRAYTDLDFIVPQRCMAQAIAVLDSAGYQVRFDPAIAESDSDSEAPDRYAFVNGSIRTLVELHTERTLHYFPRPLNLEDMHSRLSSLAVGSETLRTFSVEDSLILLCVHGAQHFWERLGWILDVARLISAGPVDWTLAMRIASEGRCSRFLLLGAFLAHDYFDAPVPPEVLNRAKSDARVRWLVDKVQQEIEGSFISSTGALPRAAFQLKVQEGLREQASHLLRLVSRPADIDPGETRFPDEAIAPASILRPLEALRSLGRGIRRRPKPDLAPFVPTPPHIVKRMLELAELTREDVLYDLGCGHGAIVVAAAKTHGVRAVGVDIDPRRIDAARAHARAEGVEDRVQFILGDAKKIDFHDATVVTIYLGIAANLRLADRFREQLRPGSRIVSRDFQIYSWKPDVREQHSLEIGAPTYLYLWKMKDRES